MLVTTNRRLVQAITLVLSFAIVFPPQFAIASQSSTFQQAMEAKDAKKWKKALSLFASVSENDPDYGRALDEIALINDLQKGDREAHNTRYKAERLMEKLDRGADKCVGLLKRDGSPEVHGCFDEMSKVEGEISEMLKSSNYEHPTLRDLDKQLVPYRKFDEVALPVTKVRPTKDEMELAAEKVLALEEYSADANNPANLRALGAFVLSQFHLGGARAHAKDCARLRSDPETKNTQATADICGFAEEASMKYGEFVRRLDSSNLIDGPSIPSMAYKAVAPIKSDKLPKPEVVSVLVSTPKNDSKNIQDSQSSWTTYLVVGGISAVAMVLGTVFLRMRAAKPAQQPAPAQPPAVSVPAPQPLASTSTAAHPQPTATVSQPASQPTNAVNPQEDNAPISQAGSRDAHQEVGGQQKAEVNGSPFDAKKFADLRKRIDQLNVNKENGAQVAPPPETRVLREANAFPEQMHLGAASDPATPNYARLVAKGEDPKALLNMFIRMAKNKDRGYAQMLRRFGEENKIKVVIKTIPEREISATVQPDATPLQKEMARMINAIDGVGK